MSSPRSVKGLPVTPMRVVKVGGSLFAAPQLTTWLEQWLAASYGGTTWLVVGGGELADAVRLLDEQFGLRAADAHRQAILAMRVNAFTLTHTCRRMSWLGYRDDQRLPHAPASLSPTTNHWVLDPLWFLHTDQWTGRSKPVPATWQVTSDSLAAQLAIALSASELVLLKSALPRCGTASTTCSAVAAAGFVDEYFPLAAHEIPRVRIVDLCSDGFPEMELLGCRAANAD